MARSAHMVQKVREGELVLVEQNRTIHLTPESETCAMVEPNSHNIHRVESVGGPAAFLDILAPPYNIEPNKNPHGDRQERDCHYFREVAEAPGRPEGGKMRKWLLLSEPPPTFYCDTEPYRGPHFDASAPRKN